jgi:hypothetical protein
MSNKDIISKQLDSDWIDDFEKKDSHYEIFYKENIHYVPIHSIYIDRNSNIQTIKEEKHFVSEKNKITREELLGILKCNCFHNDNRYTVLSILKYNITLEPGEVENFLKTSALISYLSVIKNIDTIHYDNTITMFQDLNDLFILFYEKPKKNENSFQTKKIIISHPRKKTLRKIA